MSVRGGAFDLSQLIVVDVTMPLSEAHRRLDVLGKHISSDLTHTLNLNKWSREYGWVFPTVRSNNIYELKHEVFQKYSLSYVYPTF